MMVITFTPDGQGQALYSEIINLADIGPLAIRRATVIEYEDHEQVWCVRELSGSPLFHHPSRQTCLDWERQHLEQQEDQKHELSSSPGAVAAGL